MPVRVRPRAPASATFVVSFKHSAFTTLSMVARLGLQSGESALYRPSREMPVSLASCTMPRARAMSPKAAAMYAASSPASSMDAVKYAAVSSSLLRYSHNVVARELFLFPGHQSLQSSAMSIARSMSLSCVLLSPPHRSNTTRVPRCALVLADREAHATSSRRSQTGIIRASPL